MPCSLHDVRISSCDDCTSEYLLEENVLSLGPRSVRQFRHLMASMKAKRVPRDVQLCRGQYCHRVHRLAFYIKRFVDKEINISELPAPTRIQTLLKANRNEKVVSSMVQFLEKNKVRAKTPLQIYDKDSLEKGILAANIKGHKLVELVAEYAAACSDIDTLLKQDRVFTDSTTVWHRSTVPAHSPDALKAWRQKISAFIPPAGAQ